MTFEEMVMDANRKRIADLMIEGVAQGYAQLYNERGDPSAERIREAIRELAGDGPRHFAEGLTAARAEYFAGLPDQDIVSLFRRQILRDKASVRPS